MKNNVIPIDIDRLIAEEESNLEHCITDEDRAASLERIKQMAEIKKQLGEYENARKERRNSIAQKWTAIGTDILKWAGAAGLLVLTATIETQDVVRGDAWRNIQSKVGKWL